MQEFSANDKMLHLVQTNPNLLPMIHRFGIRLGFGNHSVQELCNDYGVNTNFFLAIVNAYHHKHYFPEEHLLGFSPLLILDYLKKTHDYYIHFSLPQIEELIHRLLESTPEQNSEMKMIEAFYRAYKAKLLKHIADEETRVFPFVERLVLQPNSIVEKAFDMNFEKEHAHVDLELDDLKNLILKYLVSDYDVLVCNKLMDEIYRFEKDIRDHSRMEDVILIPQVELLLKSTQ